LAWRRVVMAHSLTEVSEEPHLCAANLVAEQLVQDAFAGGWIDTFRCF
jgi:hypothetical protein